jgi:hypothetical protein
MVICDENGSIYELDPLLTSISVASLLLRFLKRHQNPVKRQASRHLPSSEELHQDHASFGVLWAAGSQIDAP